MDGAIGIGLQDSHRAAAVEATVEGWAQTVEMVDPFLQGHSYLVRRTALLIAETLGLDADELETLSIAASLAQAGKLFIPRDILCKTERLTAAEQAIMSGHVAHCMDALSDVDFDLPVRETISGMYERLDGSGYPQGLAGERIGLLSRILGIADVFCARIRPRSYRDAVSPREAMTVLVGRDDRYDNRVVRALAKVLASSAGAMLVREAQDLKGHHVPAWEATGYNGGYSANGRSGSDGSERARAV